MQHAALKSWKYLNDYLRTANEEECRLLLEAERKTTKRMNFMLRIHAKFNVLRAERERRELVV